MNIRSEMDKGDPIFTSRVNTSPVTKVVVSLLALSFGVFGIMVAIRDDEAPWWVAVFGWVIAAIVFGAGMTLTRVAIVVQPGALYVAAGYRTAKIPIASIGYIGNVRLTRRNAMRFSMGTLTNGKPGPAVEIVTQQGKYFAILSNSSSELFDVLINQGMPPSALQVPFPADVVRGRDDYDRDPRGASTPPATRAQ